MGDPEQRAGKKGHDSEWRVAQLQPGEEGCGENEQPGSLCQKECSSFPNPSAATQPCPLPRADPGTHLSSVRIDARQEHSARKGEGLGGRVITPKSPALSGGTNGRRDTKVSIQQMTPLLKQEAHFPPQPVRKNRLLTTREHPLHIFFFSDSTVS